MLFVQVRKFGTDNRYRLKILHQCGKRVKTKSQKVFGANFYVFRSYSGKTDRVKGLLSPPPILNGVNSVTHNLFWADW